jgi:hypothetical protein
MLVLNFPIFEAVVAVINDSLDILHFIGWSNFRALLSTGYPALIMLLSASYLNAYV